MLGQTFNRRGPCTGVAESFVVVLGQAFNLRGPCTGFAQSIRLDTGGRPHQLPVITHCLEAGLAIVPMVLLLQSLQCIAHCLEAGLAIVPLVEHWGTATPAA